MFIMTIFLEDRLSKRTKSENLRELIVTHDLTDFSSNDYLGLARSSDLTLLIAQEFAKYKKTLNGWGSTGSRLLTGNSQYAQDLEDKIAAFHGFEAGLIFNCGYMANVGLLSTVAGIDDCVFFDATVHTSTHDGIRLSRAKAFPFKHNDTVHLENRLKNCISKRDRFICIESIYSTDGSIAPLLEISRLANQYQAHLIVDEAHAVGVCGPDGRGLVAEQGLSSHVFAQTNTFGKALGTQGAIILGNNLLKQALINFSTSYIYTTALPFYALAAIKCAYELFPKLENERRHIQSLIKIFQDFYTSSSKTHIQSIQFEGNQNVKRVAKNLMKQGFNVRPLMSPTVQRGHEVLRICLHAFNSEDELLLLLKGIESNKGLNYA